MSADCTSTSKSPVSLMACRMFISYLAGDSTCRIAREHAISSGRVNRSIRRTATHLLKLAGSEYEKHHPLPGLNRLKNETSLWLFRLAIVAPIDTVLALVCEGDGSGCTSDSALSYRNICDEFQAQLQLSGRLDQADSAMLHGCAARSQMFRCKGGRELQL